MSAISTKGTTISLSVGATTPDDLAPTAIVPSTTAGGDTVITVANTAAVGDVVVMPPTTGYKGLDNKVFPIKAATATDITIAADTHGQAGPMAVGMKVQHYAKAAMLNLCLSSFDIAAGSTNEIDVSTYCSAGSILGKTTPGSITLNGFVDNADTGFMELVKAGDDGVARVLDIDLPGTLGHLVGVVAFSEMSFSVPLEGAVGFSITASQNKAVKYVPGA
jgi:hypothetical protein